MTREELIHKWNSYKGIIIYPTDNVKELINATIKALEQEPCEDCISRQAVLDCFKKWQPYMATRLWEFELELSQLPSARPQSETVTEFADRCRECGAKYGKLLKQEPKTGHWIKAKPWMLDYTSYKWECSECEKSERFRHNYCPNCGARMESEQDG